MAQEQEAGQRTALRGLLATEPLLLLGAAVIVLYFAREILIPLALALTLNFLLTPAVMLLQRLGLRRLPAALLVLLMAVGGIAGVGYVVTRQLIHAAEELAASRENIHRRLGSLHAPNEGPVARALIGVEAVGEEISAAPAIHPGAEPAPGQPQVLLNQPLPVTVVPRERGALAEMREVLAPVLRPLGEAGIVLVFTTYMLVRREDLRNRLLLLAGMGRLNLVTQALNDAAQRISRYLLMNFAVNAGYGLLFGSGLFLLGVPNATLWGVIAGILRVVPYVGTLIGVVLPLIFSLAVAPGLWTPLAVLGLFVLLEAMVSNVLEPWLYGAHTGISPLALLTTAIFWTLIWGWPGLVLSTPLTVCLIVMGRYVPQMSFLHILLGEDAELGPEAKFYERLLSMDQSEAHLIADRFLEGRRLVDLYDGMVLPALSLAEQDRHKGVLDDVRATYLFQSATELIAELTDYHLREQAEAGRSSNGLGPSQFRVRCCPVVCVSSSDQADEIAATMLAQLLEQQENRTLVLPASALTPEILVRLSEEPETVVCISALPPFAFAQSRAICQRVRQHLPRNLILVGLWSTTEELDRLRTRYGNGRPDALVATLEEAVEQIRGWQSEGGAAAVLRQSGQA